MKFHHLMPYPYLPDDFKQKYRAVWVDPPADELYDPVKGHQVYNGLSRPSSNMPSAAATMASSSTSTTGEAVTTAPRLIIGHTTLRKLPAR
jgi:hypothetical protein